MNKTQMILEDGLNVTVSHQGGYVLCVEHEGVKQRLPREDLEHVESYIGSLLTNDDLLVDIMRLVCQLQQMGKVVTMDLRHKLHGDVSNIGINIFNNQQGFEAYVYDNGVPAFNSYINWGADETLPLQVLRTNLQKMVEINGHA